MFVSPKSQLGSFGQNAQRSPALMLSYPHSSAWIRALFIILPPREFSLKPQPPLLQDEATP